MTRTAILDTFNRANEGPPPSASWTNLNAGLKVISNVCGANAANSISYWNTICVSANEESYFTVTTKPANGQTCGAYVRLKDVGSIATLDGYGLLASMAAGTDSIALQRIDNAVATTLGASVSQEISTSDILCIRISGSGIEMERNGSVVITRTDTTYTAAGYLGAAISDTTGRIDNFGGGSLTSEPAVRLRQRVMNMVGRF